MNLVSYVPSVFIVAISALLLSCTPAMRTTNNSEQSVLQVNTEANGTSINIKLNAGKNHNHPSFAIWAETLDEEFIQTLFVTKSIGTGLFGHGGISAEKWDNKAGEQSRPASLPYWLHKRLSDDSDFVLPTPKNPVLDAYTGATPTGNATIKVNADSGLPSKFRLLVEVNQPWDWNEFWTTAKFDNIDYKTSCQPSVIYAVTIDTASDNINYSLNPIGHGSPTGSNGNLNTDLSTITTALNIFSKIQASIK